MVPGLVDCHTHLAFGGWRADEFTQRIQGATYLDIARAGGGIAKTVRLTREAGQDALLRRARGFVREMVALGVTTIECKSGYGLDREHELELLRVYRRLADVEPVAHRADASSVRTWSRRSTATGARPTSRSWWTS